MGRSFCRETVARNTPAKATTGSSSANSVRSTDGADRAFREILGRLYKVFGWLRPRGRAQHRGTYPLYGEGRLKVLATLQAEPPGRREGIALKADLHLVVGAGHRAVLAAGVRGATSPWHRQHRAGHLARWRRRRRRQIEAARNRHQDEAAYEIDTGRANVRRNAPGNRRGRYFYSTGRLFARFLVQLWLLATAGPGRL